MSDIIGATVTADRKSMPFDNIYPGMTQSTNTLAGLNRNPSGPTKQQKRALGQAKFEKTMGSQGAQLGFAAAGAAMDGIMGSMVETQASKGKNPTGYETQQQIGNALMSSGNPYAMAAGAAYKLVSGIAEATGGNVNTITKDQAEDLGISGIGRVANNVLGILNPGAGWLTTKVEEGQKSHLIDEMSNAYADTVADIDQAQTMGGGKYLFGKKKIANAVAEANQRNELLTEMNMTNTMRKQSDYGRDLAQQNLNRYAGTNYMDMRAGKLGMKLTELDRFKALLRNRVVEETENSDIQRFANGGSILPTGKLHKELHHLDDMGEQFEDLTRKGIPVVTMDEGGEIVQVAEIERDEWTWSKEFTDQIEALWKDESEESMIEAGKLICEELLRNTQDEGGLLNG